MKILLANYRYFVSGGPERYMFNVSDALQIRGHTVVPFSVQYRRNLPTPYSKYFVSPIGSVDDVYFDEHARFPATVLKTLERLFYSSEVRTAVRRLVQVERPDIAYVLHYLRKLSPALLVGLKEEGVPIVVRLSDYQMCCPQAHFLRGGEPCRLCASGDLFPSIRHGCIKGSVPASFVNALATWYHRSKGYFDLIDRFVVTNSFMLETMLAAGVSEKRIALIPTFAKDQEIRPEFVSQKADVVAYVGRVEFLKGVHVLIEAVGLIAQRFPEVAWRFEIAGEGDQAYLAQLRQRCQQLGITTRVAFLGLLQGDALSDLFARSQAQVVPSLWFENLPNSLLEGYAAGVPAIGSDIGSLPGTITQGKTGFLFRTGDPQSLADTLVGCWRNRTGLSDMGLAARLLAATEYSENRHLDRLTHLFDSLRTRNTRSAPELAKIG